MKRYIMTRPAVLWIAIAAYIFFFVVLTIWKLNHFYYDNLDLAIFNNVFWNTMHGRWFEASIHPPSYLADHFSPIILLLVPLYALKPGPQILLIMQTVGIALAAVPVYSIARHFFKKEKPWLPVYAAVLWLVNPSVHNMNFFEFELLPFAALFLLCATYYYLQKSVSRFALFLLLALLVREDAAFIVGFFSIVAVLDRRSALWKIIPAAAALAYSALSFPIIAQYAPTSYKFLVYYGWLGGTDALSIAVSFITHPLRVIGHLLTWGNLEFVLGITFPFFFVFSASSLLVLAIPPLAQILLSASGAGALTLSTHYAGYFLAVLFPVFIISMKKIEGLDRVKWIPEMLRSRKVIAALIASATIYASLTYGSVVPAFAAWKTPHQEQEKKALAARVPAEASVAATFELLTPLSTRQHIYSLHYAALGTNQFALTDYTLPADTQFLAIDWEEIVKTQIHISAHPRLGKYAETFDANLQRILEGYTLIYADGSLTLWVKSTDSNASLLASLAPPTEHMSAADARIVGTARGDANNPSSVRIYMPKNAATEPHYYLEIATQQRKFLLPLAYATATKQEADAVLTMPLFLEPDEALRFTAKLFRWDNGFLKLGALKNLEAVTDARPL